MSGKERHSWRPAPLIPSIPQGEREGTSSVGDLLRSFLRYLRTSGKECHPWATCSAHSFDTSGRAGRKVIRGQPAPLIPSIPQDEREGTSSVMTPRPRSGGAPLHELVAAHDARRLPVHDHVHAGRLSRREGALDGGANLVRLRDVLPVAAQPLHHLVVAGVVAQDAGDHPLLAVHRPL